MGLGQEPISDKFVSYHFWFSLHYKGLFWNQLKQLYFHFFTRGQSQHQSHKEK